LSNLKPVWLANSTIFHPIKVEHWSVMIGYLTLFLACFSVNFSRK